MLKASFFVIIIEVILRKGDKMSKIKIFGLGGLNEYGKNMYVVQVDEDIYVFDAGLKYGDETLYGIDYVIPDYTYLKQNKEHVKGIFLSHGHDEYIGALADILKDMNNLDVYGSKFTMDVVTEMLKEDGVEATNLHVIEAHQKLTFGKNSIFPIMLTHSTPDNFGYTLYTEDGAIFYTGNYMFDPTMMGPYKTDVGKLAYLGKQGVLCMLGESIYADRPGFTSPNHRIDNLIRSTLSKAEDRIIVNVFSTNIYRIQELFSEIMKTDKKVVIMGKRLQVMIQSLIDMKYMEFDKSRIGDLSNINDPNVIIMVSSENEKPFTTLNRIVNGYDKFIKIKSTDTVIFLEIVQDNMERIAVKVIDSISKIGANVVTLSRKQYVSHHASSEDIMLMLDLIKPKYYFPVIGQYRYQVANAKVAYKTHMNEENVLLRLNGEIVTFINGKLDQKEEHLDLEEMMIDGKSSKDIGELVLKDREMLSDNGIVIISTTLDRRTKEVLAGPEVLTRGFIYVKENSEIITEISKISLEAIRENLSTGHLEYNKVKNTIRDNVGKYLYKQTECKPMIISILLEI